jgi:hypothetical protein
MRTLNPKMLRRYREQFGEELFSFPEETAYEGGRVYVFTQTLNNNNNGGITK